MMRRCDRLQPIHLPGGSLRGFITVAAFLAVTLFNKELAIGTLAKYTKVSDPNILEDSYRFSLDGLSKDAFMPREAFVALVEQLTGQKATDEAAAKKLPVTVYFDNRYINESEKEGFFKKLWP